MPFALMLFVQRVCWCNIAGTIHLGKETSLLESISLAESKDATQRKGGPGAGTYAVSTYVVLDRACTEIAPGRTARTSLHQ
jgi:hypothetical protein